MDNLNPNLKRQARKELDIIDILKGLQCQNRNALAQAITLLESKNPDHQELKAQILEWAYSSENLAKRIGITGSPGVGKSSLIEKIALKLIDDSGQKVAVLSVDPSSKKSGGSILGDKTRMERLAKNGNAFIRPSPSDNILGGVGGATRESIMLCEAFGFDWVIVETVGVGQSEIEVQEMCDAMILLLLPGAGDQVQGIKRGIVEMADLMVITKAEAERKKQVDHTYNAYRQSVSFIRHPMESWKIPLVRTSSLEDLGLNLLIENIEAYFLKSNSSGFFQEKRKEQSVHWYRQAVTRELEIQLQNHIEWSNESAMLEEKVSKGSLAPGQAARQLVRKIFYVEAKKK